MRTLTRDAMLGGHRHQGGLEMEATIRHGADTELLAWLARSGIRHELHEHPEAFTARGTAFTEGIDPHTFAKVVGVETDTGHRMLFVLEATDDVDLHKARVILGARRVRLLTEAELAALAPGSETGAMPAVGMLYGLPVLADEAIRGLDALTFNAGSHHISVRVDCAEWAEAAGVLYADLAHDVDTLPAWARS